MGIKIGDVRPARFENWDVIPDDRQSRIETIGGIVIQDFGHVEDGDKFSCEVTLSSADTDTIYNYWHNRTRVNVIDEGGQVFENLRVVVKEYGRIKYLPTYFAVKLEFWRK